jgi:REP element-mobilizing transposase RayT
MAYHPRIETDLYSSFLTTRSRNSELWFINNKPLEQDILAYAAKYAERYEVSLYALALEGNHKHMTAHFPKLNRGDFMRDLNASISRAVPRHTPEYPGGTFWGRRYSQEFICSDADILDKFFYTVLQPVQDGLVERISDYPGYNCFHDAVWGIEREHKVVNWGAYNSARRYSSKVRVKDFTYTVTLKYARLPGYEDMPQREYALLMHKKLEERRQKIVAARYAEGLGFAGRDALLAMKRGTRPKNTKTSTIKDHRPRVLSKCAEVRKKGLEWYFDKYYRYKAASKRYRAGERDVVFPPGMYPPHLRPDPT